MEMDKLALNPPDTCSEQTVQHVAQGRPLDRRPGSVEPVVERSLTPGGRKSHLPGGLFLSEKTTGFSLHSRPRAWPFGGWARQVSDTANVALSQNPVSWETVEILSSYGQERDPTLGPLVFKRRIHTNSHEASNELKLEFLTLPLGTTGAGSVFDVGATWCSAATPATTH